jgi:ABC-type nitrate/sulfonate/bicarbonate transport system substrate-binding protein
VNTNLHSFDRRSFVRYLTLGTGAIVVGPSFLAACGGDDSGGSSDTTASAGSTGSSGAPATLTKVAIQLSWVKTVEFAGYFIADDGGIYADNGLTVDLVAGGPNAPQPEQSIIGGATQFGVPDFSNLVSAVKAGAELVTVGAQLQRNMTAFISLPDNPVNSLADLVGKKVGGSNPADEEVYKNMLESAGLSTDFTFVPIGADPSPLTEGAVDCYVGFMSNQPLTLKERGVDTVVLPFQDVGVPFYTGSVTVSKSYLKDNRDTVKAFLKATVMGYEINAQDPAPGAELTVNKYSTDQGLTVPKETESNVIYIESQSSDLTKEKGYFYMDPDFISGPVYEGLAKYGLTDLPDPATYVDMSLLDEIYDGKTTLL